MSYSLRSGRFISKLNRTAKGKRMRPQNAEIPAEEVAQERQVLPPPPPPPQQGGQAEANPQQLGQAPPGFHAHKYNVNLKMYDGKTNPAKWWQTFLAYTILQRMQNFEAILVLPFYLTGMAEQWFQSLSEDMKTSLRQIEQLFIQRFKPVQEHQLDLSNLRQQPGESIDEYISRAQHLNSNKSVAESFLVTLTAKGLHPDIAKSVLEASPKDMMALRERASIVHMANMATSGHQQQGITVQSLQEMETRMLNAMDTRMDATVRALATNSNSRPTFQQKRPFQQPRQQFQQPSQFQQRPQFQQKQRPQQNCLGCGNTLMSKLSLNCMVMVTICLITAGIFPVQSNSDVILRLNDSVLVKENGSSLIDAPHSINSNNIDGHSMFLYELTCISTCIDTLTIFLLFCLFCKTRQIITIIFVFGQLAYVKSQTAPSFIFQKPTQIADTTSAIEHFLQSEFSWMHASVILSTIVIILLSIVFYMLYQSKQTKATRLMLEVTSGGDCVIIPLSQLSLCPTYYQFSRPVVRDLTLSEFPDFKVFATWSTFKVTDKITGQTVSIPTKFSVNIFTWFKLWKITRQPFYSYILITHHAYSSILNAPIEGTTEHEGTNTLYPSLLGTSDLS